MTCNSTIHPVSRGLGLTTIGNGLFAQVRRPETIWEAHLRRQRDCKHEKRDPRGTCYHCGHRMPCGRRGPSVVEVTIHFGRADARVEIAHIGTVHWVNLWTRPNEPSNGVRIFCTTPEAAEALAEAFVTCGARRVNPADMAGVEEDDDDE